MKRLLFIIPLLFAVMVHAEPRTSNYIRDRINYDPVYTVTPDKGDSILNSDYGSYVKRVSDIDDSSATTFNSLQASGSTSWSTVNYDGTMVMVFGVDSTSTIVYDITTEIPTYVAELKKDGNALSANNEIGHTNELRWDMSGSFPNRVYYVGNPIRGNGPKFSMIGDVTDQDNTRSLIRDFEDDFTGGGKASTADWGSLYRVANDTEGMTSNDNRYWAFMSITSGGGIEFVFTYDKTGDTILGVLEATDFGETGNIQRVNTVGIAPDGSSAFVHGPRYYNGCSACAAWDDDTFLDGPHSYPLDLDVDTYTTGTVTVTNGSDQVDATGGASFTGFAGEFFRVSGDYNSDQTNTEFRWYLIASVEDSTNMTLAENFQGSSDTGKSFDIHTQAIPRLSPDFSHFGWGCDKSGEHVFVAQNNRTDGNIWSDNLGVWTEFFDEPTEFGAFPGIHIGRTYDCSEKKGWVMYDITSGTSSGVWYQNQIVMYELDDTANSPDRWRVTHKYGRIRSGNDWDENHANLSFDGNSAYWRSAWNNQFDNTAANHGEVIRVLMPEDWHCVAYSDQTSCEESDQCAWDGACELTGGPVCDAENCDLCLSQETCEAVESDACTWDGSCGDTPPPEPPETFTTFSGGITFSGGVIIK